MYERVIKVVVLELLASMSKDLAHTLKFGIDITK